MHPADTIIALATGWAASPRALVRLSGHRVPDVLRHACDSLPSWPAKGSVASTSVMIRARSSSPSTPPVLRVPALIAMYPAPRSYTGEHGAELMIPGNPFLIERVIAAFLELDGVREASPGEFTARAYLNGRLTLEQAEGVAATISARNEDELAAARRVTDGDAGRAHARRVDELAGLLALVEAGIDFTDQEDVVPIAPADLLARVLALTDGLRAELGAARGSERVSSDPRVVLVGRPNAGKSTLFNALLGRRRTAVSDVAGTTRDVVEEELDLSEVAPGARVLLTDLAGLDHAASSTTGGVHEFIDAEAQRRAKEAIRAANVLVLCDPRASFRELERVIASEHAVIRVRTKGDLLHLERERPTDPSVQKTSRPVAHADVPSPALAVCALDGWNLNPLRRAIADAACRDRASAAMSVLPRHRRAIERSLAALDDAARAMEPHRCAKSIQSVEVVAGSLRASLDALTELSGRLSPDDVIGRIFATFCIGK